MKTRQAKAVQAPNLKRGDVCRVVVSGRTLAGSVAAIIEKSGHARRFRIFTEEARTVERVAKDISPAVDGDREKLSRALEKFV